MTFPFFLPESLVIDRGELGVSRNKKKKGMEEKALYSWIYFIFSSHYISECFFHNKIKFYFLHFFRKKQKTKTSQVSSQKETNWVFFFWFVILPSPPSTPSPPKNPWIGCKQKTPRCHHIFFSERHLSKSL